MLDGCRTTNITKITNLEKYRDEVQVQDTVVRDDMSKGQNVRVFSFRGTLFGDTSSWLRSNISFIYINAQI
jgi:hypothetical protein